MGRARTLLPGDLRTLTRDVNNGTSLGVTPLSDVLYIALTVVVFAVLLLILKGVEHIER
jgi:hypothetical protein